MSIDLTPHKAARRASLRLFRCMFRQKSRNQICPELPRLDGKTVLVTGGTAGVGEFISHGLVARGARVVSLSRGVSQGKGPLAEVRQIKCDLSKLESVVGAINELGDQKVDILICNSGVMMREHRMATKEIEMTYAVNVLGHHLLYRLLIERKQFAEAPRIVMTSGDAYVTSTVCEPNPSNYNGNVAYCNSKLGNLWQVKELIARYPSLHANAVHPGVVFSGFSGMSGKGGPGPWLARKLLISIEQGAQAALIAATQNLPNGAYWHNTNGIMALPSGDAALAGQKSATMWDQRETFSAPYL